MGNKNYSDAKISKYFLKMSSINKNIPNMTEISKKLGLSNATVSRYAKKKGYYNFGEMRAKFNKTLGSDFAPFNDLGLSNFLKYEKIKIHSSKSTKIIRDFLINRLSFLPTNISVATNDSVFNKNTILIFISLTGESNSMKKYIDNLNTPTLIITTKKISEFNNKKNIEQILLNDFNPIIRNHYEINNSIVKIINWLNEAINIYELKRENNK